MPERPENPNQPPIEQRPTPEREIRREEIDLVMKKVVDLNKEGYAYSRIRQLGMVIKEGILGSTSARGEKTTKEKWDISMRI